MSGSLLGPRCDASIEPARWRPRVPSCNTRCDKNRKLPGRLVASLATRTDAHRGPTVTIFPPAWAREARRVWPGAALVAAHRVQVASSGCWR